MYDLLRFYDIGKCLESKWLSYMTIYDWFCGFHIWLFMSCLIGESGAPVSGSMSFSDFVCFCFMFFNGFLNCILEPLKTSEKKKHAVYYWQKSVAPKKNINNPFKKYIYIYNYKRSKFHLIPRASGGQIPNFAQSSRNLCFFLFTCLIQFLNTMCLHNLLFCLCYIIPKKNEIQWLFIVF